MNQQREYQPHWLIPTTWLEFWYRTLLNIEVSVALGVGIWGLIGLRALYWYFIAIAIYTFLVLSAMGVSIKHNR